MPRIVSPLIATLGLIALVGCASGLQAIGESLRYAVTPDQRVTRASLNPNFEYLRARVNGRLVMLALGYVDQPENGLPVQVFYSSEGETLKLQGGRIIGFSSPIQNIQALISASDQVVWNLAGPSSFERRVDSRPDYRFSKIQRLTVEKLPRAPGRRNLEDINPDGLIWFKETVQGGSSDEPLALFALERVGDRFEVVYSEQCIATDLCLSLQRWRALGAY